MEPTGDAAGEPTKSRVWNESPLAPESENLAANPLREEGTVFEVLQQRWAVITTAYACCCRRRLSPSSALIGTHRTLAIPNWAASVTKSSLQLAEDIFAIPGQVHFV